MNMDVHFVHIYLNVGSSIEPWHFVQRILCVMGSVPSSFIVYLASQVIQRKLMVALTNTPWCRGTAYEILTRQVGNNQFFGGATFPHSPCGMRRLAAHLSGAQSAPQSLWDAPLREALRFPLSQGSCAEPGNRRFPQKLISFS
jgi:hypothetical protein